MTFADAIRTCLAKYANFNGRAGRPEYWWFFLAVCLGSAAASQISLRASELFGIAIFLPLIAAGARRLHDTNRSGWFQLFALVPFGIVIPLILLAQETKPPRQ